MSHRISTIRDNRELGLDFEQSKVMSVLHFSARHQQNRFALQIKIHQIYPGQSTRSANSIAIKGFFVND